MSPIRAAACLLALSACSPLPDTVGEAAPARTVWRLDQVNNAAATFPATLRLLEDGRVIGAAPCGRFEARQVAPLPWVEFADFAPAADTCRRAEEQRGFFLALRAMDFAEVAGSSLLLSNDAGQSLYFRAAEGPGS
ncbi:META domain-containing protein [Rhodobacteraceae bacterium 2CG4]|uniref:META domain-containing protein n=1 Tax=Halovulum marinum TaxID=2662447 RepID=A0A6L5YV30_9RHOB|nr:META domain-containing protein [Halovulum marinum]MSU88141.1 META domain-containing protein [Halovulum marinum]